MIEFKRRGFPCPQWLWRDAKGKGDQKCPLGPLLVIFESLGQAKASYFPWWPEGLDTIENHTAGWRVVLLVPSSLQWDPTTPPLPVAAEIWKGMQGKRSDEQECRPKAVWTPMTCKLVTNRETGTPFHPIV